MWSLDATLQTHTDKSLRSWSDWVMALQEAFLPRSYTRHRYWDFGPGAPSDLLGAGSLICEFEIKAPGDSEVWDPNTVGL